MRKFLIAGNWKMNLNADEGADLVADIVSVAGKQTSVNVCLCPPFTGLESAAKGVEGSNVSLGAQNFHPEPSGAYTGEISAGMLRHLYCSHVILGHSERREYFAETDAFINQKVKNFPRKRSQANPVCRRNPRATRSRTNQRSSQKASTRWSGRDYGLTI